MISRTIINTENETLPGAVLYVSDAQGKPIPGGASASANENGYLLLNVTNPDTIVTARYIGHEQQTKKVREFPAVIVLKPTGQLDEVTVTAKRSYYILGTLLALLLIYKIKK